MTNGIQELEYKDFSRRVWDLSAEGPRLTRAEFEITYRCNIHCVHCYTDPFNTPAHLRRELPPDEILRILDELAEAGVLWLLLTGGEAFVHPHFREIYKEAKARGFIVSIFSNGTTLTEDLARFLENDPPFQLELSCHGASPEIFDRVAQVPGSFKRFLEGIRRILAHGLPLRIKTKAMTINRHELSEIKTLVESFGLDFSLSTVIHPRLDGDLSSTDYRISPEEIIEIELGSAFDSFEEEEESCGTEKASAAFSPSLTPPPDDRLFRCGCGTNTVKINPYGILRACTFTTWPSYDLRSMSVREAFERLVEEIHNARYTGDSPCRVCPVHRFCDKHPVMALYEAGSMEAPVPHFCETAFGKAAKLTGENLFHGTPI